MEFFTEIVLIIFVEGSLGFIEEGKAPRGLRITVAAILIAVWFGIFGGLIYGAITFGHPVLIAFAVLLSVGATAWMVYEMMGRAKKARKKK
ncbi:MAG: hypothetical protein IJD82_07775 [Clostridia bacterium]|nr:hypothetical protein [Clostridia bacterium]